MLKKVVKLCGEIIEGSFVGAAAFVPFVIMVLALLTASGAIATIQFATLTILLSIVFSIGLYFLRQSATLSKTSST